MGAVVGCALFLIVLVVITAIVEGFMFIKTKIKK